MPVPRITREDLKVKLENPDPAARPVVFDVRLKYPYEHSTMTLPGAVRPPEGMAEVAKDRDIVAYDSDPDELVSSEFAAGLIKAGYRVSVLKGGISEWLAANLPIATKAAPKQAAPEPGSLKG